MGNIRVNVQLSACLRDAKTWAIIKVFHGLDTISARDECLDLGSGHRNSCFDDVNELTCRLWTDLIDAIDDDIVEAESIDGLAKELNQMFSTWSPDTVAKRFLDFGTYRLLHGWLHNQKLLNKSADDDCQIMRLAIGIITVEVGKTCIGVIQLLRELFDYPSTWNR